MLERIRDALDKRAAGALLAITWSTCSPAEEIPRSFTDPAPTDSPAFRQLLESLPASHSFAADSMNLERIDFQASDSWHRIFRIRQVSILTLAEKSDTRLFLGINRDGILGVHFAGVSRTTRDRYVELMRLPHLREPVDRR